MKYSKVYIDSFGYQLAPAVITSADLEKRLEPLYRALRFMPGQLEALTGIRERRWWEPGYPLSHGAVTAAQKAVRASSVPMDAIGALIYAGVCREQFEPATACRVAAGLGVSESCAIYDISNACLGVLNGILEVANRIELGQIRAGLVVSCESARDINDIVISRLVNEPRMELFAASLATLTGGSGAVAVLLTDGSFGLSRRRLVGGVTKAAPEHFGLCRWGIERQGDLFSQYMATDAVSVMKYGVELGSRTWEAFLGELDWKASDVDRTVCHQVGSIHQAEILKTIGLSADNDFITYPFLGNMGTVSLPISAALADEREFIEQGHRVGFLGIGSGLNCLMLGIEW